MLVYQAIAARRFGMDWKKLCKKLLFPHIGVMAVLTVFSAAGLTFVFMEHLNESPIAYAVYLLSFYTLSVVCIFLGMVLPKRYKEIRKKVYENPLGNRYMTDVEFKNRVSLYCSLGINLLYVGTNLFSAFWYRSAWFAVFAGYYMILAVMRFLLVRYIHKHKLSRNRMSEMECARVCAAILTTVSLVLSCAVPMILYQDKGFEYHGMLIYVMALYTFYITISAGAELIKHRKYDNPILSVSKAVKMAAALVSMLALETAMFSQFGTEMSLGDKRLMIAATGAGVSAIIIITALYIIVRTTKGIKKIRRQDQNGE